MLLIEATKEVVPYNISLGLPKRRKVVSELNFREKSGIYVLNWMQLETAWKKSRRPRMTCRD